MPLKIANMMTSGGKKRISLLFVFLEKRGMGRETPTYFRALGKNSAPLSLDPGKVSGLS